MSDDDNKDVPWHDLTDVYHGMSDAEGVLDSAFQNFSILEPNPELAAIFLQELSDGKTGVATVIYRLLDHDVEEMCCMHHFWENIRDQNYPQLFQHFHTLPEHGGTWHFWGLLYKLQLPSLVGLPADFLSGQPVVQMMTVMLGASVMTEMLGVMCTPEEEMMRTTDLMETAAFPFATELLGCLHNIAEEFNDDDDFKLHLPDSAKQPGHPMFEFLHPNFHPKNN